MKTIVSVNNIKCEWNIEPGENLLSALRRYGYLSVKSGGCEQGECGACTILLDGKTCNACMMLAAQAENHSIETIEAMGEHPEKGWKKSRGLHIIQQAFVDYGAIQCGYCTPAMVLAARSLLERNTSPTEGQIREALSGILCRCTGYTKPVQAILKAAAILRGDEVIPIINDKFFPDEVMRDTTVLREEDGVDDTENHPKELCTPSLMMTPSKTRAWATVGKPEAKVDAVKLVQGKPAFAGDINMEGVLIAKVLRSPHAHARIKNIDASKAKALPGVAAILTWQDIPRVAYSTAGQSDPIPGPLDSFSLDNKVRHVGDRVAFVAAENEEIANNALSLIHVEYEILPAIFDPSESMNRGDIIIHDEKDFVDFDKSDQKRNLAAKIRIDVGDVDKGFSEADQIFEYTYVVPKVQQAHIEPHVVFSYWDEDDRLVIRTSTQVPFHARRILAPVLNLPIKRIRVCKPRIGGGFGGKQEVLIEDVAAHLTIATNRPVYFELSREEEFIGTRSRHPMKISMKTGVKNDGTITANQMYCLSDTGAYGCHALTVTGNTGHKSMALYVGDNEYRKSPNIRFYADIVYTNLPPSGAFRGYGVPQGYWAVERQMEKISRKLGLDPIEFRLRNALRSGELHPFSTAWSEGREPKPETILTNGLESCVEIGKSIFEWDQKYYSKDWRQTENPNIRRGIGVALVMQGTAIPYLDMGGASLKMNDDGSFNLLVGATDLGTGSDTVLAQMAAEILGISISDVIVYSSDTDFTPFDTGAYASSTTYISGAAVAKAAEQVADKIRNRAAAILHQKYHLDLQPEEIKLKCSKAYAPNGKYVTLTEIAHHALHHSEQEQIMAVASHYSKTSPPPFGAQFAQVTVDVETGQVIVEKLVMVVDSGTVINQLTASGQIEGGMTQALGYAVCEEMTFDKDGKSKERDLVDYHIFRSNEMPELEAYFVETYEPTHPFGAKAVAEIPMDGVAPAVGNAIFDACGANVDEIPATPQRVWEAIKRKELQ